MTQRCPAYRAKSKYKTFPANIVQKSRIKFLDKKTIEEITISGQLFVNEVIQSIQQNSLSRIKKNTEEMSANIVIQIVTQI